MGDDLYKAEVLRWQSIAVWLTHCQAATAFSLPKRTSASELRRQASICEKAAKMLQGTDDPPHGYEHPIENQLRSAIDRCSNAIKEIGERLDQKTEVGK